MVKEKASLWEIAKTAKAKNYYSHKKDTKVAGILCFQNILVKRLTKPPPIRVLTRLFADGDARHLAFVTTHWDRVQLSQGEAREQQFQRRVQSFLNEGARMERFDMSQQAAQEIVRSLLDGRQNPRPVYVLESTGQRS